MPAGLETRDTADLEVCATSRRFGIHHRTYGLDHLAWAGEGDGQQRREDSWKDAFALEYQPSQSCQTEVGTRWRQRRAADIPTGAQENSFGTPSEHLRSNTVSPPQHIPGTGLASRPHLPLVIGLRRSHTALHT